MTHLTECWHRNVSIYLVFIEDIIPLNGPLFEQSWSTSGLSLLPHLSKHLSIECVAIKIGHVRAIVILLVGRRLKIDSFKFYSRGVLKRIVWLNHKVDLLVFEQSSS